MIVIIILIVIIIFILSQNIESYQSTFDYNAFNMQRDNKYYNFNTPEPLWNPYQYGYYLPEKHHTSIGGFAIHSYYGKPNAVNSFFHGYVPRNIYKRELSDPEFEDNPEERCHKYAKYLCRHMKDNNIKYQQCISRSHYQCLNKIT